MLLAAASLNTPTEPNPGDTNMQFDVTYTDATAVSAASLGDDDIQVTGPNGYNQFATLQSINGSLSNRTPIIATYQIPAPGGYFDHSDNGTYTVNVEANAVANSVGDAVPAGAAGTFNLTLDSTAPTAQFDPPSQPAGGDSTLQFGVTYTDDTAVRAVTLGDNDVEVIGPNGFHQYATLQSINGSQSNRTPITATYQISAPGTSFGSNDNGTYTFLLHAGTVTDSSLNPIAAATLGVFNLAVDSTPPIPEVAAPSGVKFNDTVIDFNVTYGDNQAVSAGSLGNGNLQVTGPNGYNVYAKLISLNGSQSDRTPIVATYEIPAPGGLVDAGDLGTYTVIAAANSITDVAGNAVPAGTIGTFNLTATASALPLASPANVAPRASLNQILDQPTGGDTTLQFDVTYSDDSAIAASSLGNDDITVTGPNGFSQPATLIAINGSLSNRTPIVATYQITAPGGSFDVGDNGVYTVSVNNGAVTDDASTPVTAGSVGTFTIAIETNPPLAALNTPITQPTGSATTLDFTVTYSDDTAVDASSLDNADLMVTGPNGFSRTASLISINGSLSNRTPIIATYQIAAPGGSFDISDNGTYHVILQPNQVADSNGNFAPGGDIGSFVIALETNPPKAFLNTLGQPNNGDTSFQFGVTYTDDTAVAASSIGGDDIRVTGPNGFSVPASLVSLNGSQSNRTPIIATYSFPAPGGTVGPEDSGGYTFTLQAGSVLDSNGNAIKQAALGTLLLGAGSANLVNRNLNITGTTGADTVNLSTANGMLTVTVNGTAQQFSLTDVSTISVFTGDGSDSVSVGAGTPAVLLNGGAGDDTMTGAGGNDTLQGGPGNDLLSGGGGADNLAGGDGNDTLKGGAGPDSLNGGTGADLIVGGPGNDTGAGGPGADVLVSGKGSDMLFGNAGRDIFVNGNSFADTLDGGQGINFCEPDSADKITNVTQRFDGVLPAGALPAAAAANAAPVVSPLDGVPTVTVNGTELDITAGSNPLNVSVTTDDAGHLVVDLHDNNPLAFNSPDIAKIVITGSTGNDTMTVAANITIPVLAKGLAGADSIQGGGGSDTLNGGGGADTIKGGPGDDSIRGGAGGDSINGNTGDDVLAPGNDTFTLGTNAGLKSSPDGNDTVSGGDGFDVVEYIGRTDNLTLVADGQPHSGDLAQGEADQINSDVEFIMSGFGNDTIGSSSDTSARFEAGGDGTDSILGGSGNDTMIGGPGADTVNADGGANFLFLADKPVSVDRYTFTPGQDFVSADSVDVAVLTGN
jgi:Ca2+-binding RTX toxin-like protein